MIFFAFVVHVQENADYADAVYIPMFQFLFQLMKEATYCADAKVFDQTSHGDDRS